MSATTFTAEEIEKIATWAAKQIHRAEIAAHDAKYGAPSADVNAMTDDELLKELDA